MTTLVPVEGIGLILTGEPTERAFEVWRGDKILHLTHLAEGTTTMPLASGRHDVKQVGKDLLRLQVDTDLVAKTGPGPFEVRAGKGDIHVWLLDAAGAAACLHGREPLAVAQNVVDIATLDVPHAVVHIGVQVRDGPRAGPVQVFRMVPAPRPATLAIDHDAGTAGPRTHVQVDTAGLRGVEVRVRRKVRQTGAETTGRYQVQKGEDRITFDDLLHGDVLDVEVSPPFALAAADGTAVAQRRFTYRAVPEPRLVPVDIKAPVDFEGGLTHAPDAAVNVFQTVAGSDLSLPGWSTEWPRTTKGLKFERLPDAVAKRLGGVDGGDLAHDGQALRWWLALLEAGQDAQAAETLRTSLRIRCEPEEVDAATAAVHALDGLPIDLLTDLDVPRELVGKATAFQERLGVKEQDARTAIALARATRDALDAALQAWQADLEEAGLAWLDGALDPLDDDVDLATMRKTILESPTEAVAMLRDKRRRIFKAARVSAVDATQAHDVEARRVLLRWHVEKGKEALETLAGTLQAIGVDAPAVEAGDLDALLRTTAAMARAVDVAAARVQAVPLKGPAFVEAAAKEGEATAKAMHAALGVWTKARVPPAVRTPVARLLELLPADTVSRLVVWAHFMAESAAWIRDMGTMAAAGGDLGARADRVRKAFQEASDRRDPVRFAEAAGDFRKLETAIHNARDAWQDTIRAAAPSTRRALGLAQDQDTSWDAIKRRMALDAAEIRALARLVIDLGQHDVRLDTAVRPRGDLDQVLQGAEKAGPDPQRAGAVADYDRLRRRIAGWFDGEDAVAALRAAYVTGVIEHARDRLRRSLGRAEPGRLAAIKAFPDVPGARELAVLSGFLDLVGRADPQSADTVDEVTRVAAVIKRLDEAPVDPWTAVSEELRKRVRDAYPELLKYLQDQAPRWAQLETAEQASQWLLRTCTALRNPGDHPEVAALKPGTRRLVQHVLQERGLWFPA